MEPLAGLGNTFRELLTARHVQLVISWYSVHMAWGCVFP